MEKLKAIIRASSSGIVLVYLLLLTVPVLSQDADSLFSEDKVSPITLSGYLKEMVTLGIPRFGNELNLDNTIHNRLNLKWKVHPSLMIRIEIRNRIFFGQSIRDNPVYLKQINESFDFLTIGGTITQGDSYLINSFIDRANLNWSVKKWQIVIGKQRINWGKTLVWNPNDVFNAYSFFDFDYEERRGTNAALIKYVGEIVTLEFASNVEKNSHLNTIAGKMSISKNQYDYQLILGKYKTDVVLGGAWAGQIKQVGFKGELSYFYPYIYLATASFTSATSVDYTFSNTLTFKAEFLYNSKPESKQNSLPLFDEVNVKQLSLDYFSTYASIGYDFTPLIVANLNSIWFVKGQVVFINPTLTFSLQQNVELLLAGQLFLSKPESNFYNLGNFAFVRLKWSF